MIKIEVIRQTVKAAPKPEKMTLGKDCLAALGNIGIDALQSNIEDQQQANGAPLKKNAQSTYRRKELAGQSPVKSLIDRLHRFMKSNSFKAAVGHDAVTVEPRSAELKEINVWVQEKGYTGWWGFRPKWKEMSRETIRRRIKEWFE